MPPHSTTPYSEPNDFVVDCPRGKVYIADEGAGGGGDGSRAALIVVDIATGAAQRRLEGFDGIKAETGLLVIDGEVVAHNGSDGPDGTREPMRVGVDGIAMDARGEWLYLSPLNGRTLWRLRVADLLDAALDDATLAARMERFAAKPNSGGMAFDKAGNLYLTVIETNGIGRVTPDGRYDEPVVRADMFWPDGIMRGPDGAMYVVCTQLPRSPALARPGERPTLPFKVFRFVPQQRIASVSRDVVRGAAAGVVAALAVNVFQAAWSRLRLPPTDVPATAPPVTEALADAVSHYLAGHPLAAATRRDVGFGVHYATGAAFGATYALLAAGATEATVAGGTAFGLGAWLAVEETGLAVIGLKPPPWRVAMAEQVFAAASHIVFGAVTGALLAARRPGGRTRTS